MAVNSIRASQNKGDLTQDENNSVLTTWRQTFIPFLCIPVGGG